jgi:hypothetical protein
MEKTMTWTVPAANPGVVPIPQDFLELIDLYDTSIWIKMVKVDVTKALNGVNRSPPGPPTEYARQGGQWLVSPPPPQGNQIVVEYWAELTPLVNSTDTNQVSTIAWDLIVYAALVQFGIYYKDVRIGTVQPDGSYDGWEGQYRTALSALQEQSDEDDENSAAVVEPCYNMPLDWQFEHY